MVMEEKKGEDSSSTFDTSNKTFISNAKSVTELEQLLAAEQAKTLELSETVARLRNSTAALLNTCEQAQESMSNRLIREISRLKALQLDMCDEVEAQETRLIGVLEERLKTLRNEKVELEVALECEQERMVNRLQRQMEELRHAAGLESVECHPHPPSGGGDSFSVSHPPSNSPTSPRLCLSEQINAAVSHHLEKEAVLQRQVTRLQEENQALLVENLRLQNRLRRQSIEDSPIMEPITSPASLGASNSGGGRRSRGSITELHLAGLRRTGQMPSDAELSGPDSRE